jgi:F0F1-type ATP synthase assembly protein I
VKLVPEQPQANSGVGDALATAFEFAATIAIFVAIGFGLDWWLGTTPIFLVSVTIFVLIGQTVRLWFHYGAEIEKHEEARRQRIGRAPEQ